MDLFEACNFTLEIASRQQSHCAVPGKHHRFSYGAAILGCEKAAEWQHALLLIMDAERGGLVKDAKHFSEAQIQHERSQCIGKVLCSLLCFLP